MTDFKTVIKRKQQQERKIFSFSLFFFTMSIRMLTVLILLFIFPILRKKKDVKQLKLNDNPSMLFRDTFLKGKTDNVPIKFITSV